MACAMKSRGSGRVAGDAHAADPLWGAAAPAAPAAHGDHDLHLFPRIHCGDESDGAVGYLIAADIEPAAIAAGGVPGDRAARYMDRDTGEIDRRRSSLHCCSEPCRRTYGRCRW